MDITTVFGTVVVGSSPAGSTDYRGIWSFRKFVYNSHVAVLKVFERLCGYGLVVEHVLAKDETGVRFSLPALLWPIKGILFDCDSENKGHQRWCPLFFISVNKNRQNIVIFQ
jgi:hypothetical protein